MADPMPFEGANLELKAPANAPGVRPLPAYSDGVYCITKWRLRLDELAEINRTGYVWVICLSGTKQPAMSVMAEAPIQVVPRPAPGEPHQCPKCKALMVRMQQLWKCPNCGKQYQAPE